MLHCLVLWVVLWIIKGIDTVCNRVDSPNGSSWSYATDVCMHEYNPNEPDLKYISSIYACIDGKVKWQVYNGSTCDVTPIFEEVVSSTYYECNGNDVCPFVLMRGYNLGENATNCTNKDQVPYYEYAFVYNECYIVNDTESPLYGMKSQCVQDGFNQTAYHDEKCDDMNTTFSFKWGCDITNGTGPNGNGALHSYFQIMAGKCPVIMNEMLITN